MALLPQFPYHLFCGQIFDALIKSGRWRAVHNIYGITVARFQIILIRDLILAANEIVVSPESVFNVTVLAGSSSPSPPGHHTL